jgi:hypothetical protein
MRQLGRVLGGLALVLAVGCAHAPAGQTQPKVSVWFMIIADVGLFQRVEVYDNRLCIRATTNAQPTCRSVDGEWIAEIERLVDAGVGEDPRRWQADGVMRLTFEFADRQPVDVRCQDLTPALRALWEAMAAKGSVKFGGRCWACSEYCPVAGESD